MVVCGSEIATVNVGLKVARFLEHFFPINQYIVLKLPNRDCKCFRVFYNYIIRMSVSFNTHYFYCNHLTEEWVSGVRLTVVKKK